MTAPTPPPEPGEVLAEKYVVERVLGQGGMGVVVAARHKDLDAKVAVKLLRTRPAPSVEAVERFQREARAAAKLKTDHVAKVSDVGVLADGTPFMVLEHLEGADLAELVGAGPIAPGLAAELVAQACEAVGEAHAHGIVHRDLKPSNVFVTRTVRGGARVKVLDFGISKLRSTGSEGAEAMAETAEGAMLGTPLYMSPEQMRSSRDVDGRTDVWSLGVVLYELLVGRVPWSTASIAALAVDVTTTPAPDPAAARPEVPGGLSAVVLRCLEKEPAGRFADAADLGAALEPFRAAATPAITDALLGRIERARDAIGSAPTTPLATPSGPTPTPSGRAPRTRPATPVPSTKAGVAAPPSGLGIAAGIIAIGTLAIGSMFAADRFFPSSPSPADAAPGSAAAVPPTDAAVPAADAPRELDEIGAGPALETDAHPRPCLEPPRPHCADGIRAWCHPEGTRVACCGEGLVPTMDGLCECPPGGATTEAAIASGCPRAAERPGGAAEWVRTAVRAAVVSRLDAFRRCYESAVAPGAALEGRLVLAFTVSPWGDLWDARLDGATLPSAEAQRCVLTELRALRVDPPLPGSGSTMVTYPIELGPSE